MIVVSTTMPAVCVMRIAASMGVIAVIVISWFRHFLYSDHGRKTKAASVNTATQPNMTSA